MSTAVPYAAQLRFQGELHIARCRPLVQWLLAIPQLLVVAALTQVRNVLTLISFFTVIFTRKIPRSLFDLIAMTYRYEWRTASYALFLRAGYPPFDFRASVDDDGADSHTVVRITPPESLNRWTPLYKWFLATPHYVVLLGLVVAAAAAVVAGFFAVVVSAQYPARLRTFLVGVYRYKLRLQAYVGLLNEEYPPHSLGS